MTKCPRCFSIIDDNAYAWTVPDNVPGQRYRDPVGSAYHGADVDCGPIHVVNRPPGYAGPLPASAEEASRALNAPVVEICPVCRFTLPIGWRGGQAICIAMAGARATGKSLYVAVLIKQLELLCERLGVSMEPATQATASAYASIYERPLFEQRGLIPPTPAAHTQASGQREPLVYSIGSWHGLRRFVVLRDVAGEDLEAGNLSAPHFRFFTNADAVFFMFDPLRVQVIRDQLHDLLPAQSFSGGDPRSVLSNLLLAVGDGRPRLAVILSKFDALRVLSEVEGSAWSQVMSNPGAAFMRDSSSSRSYDEADGQLLHEEVRSLLQRLHGGSIMTAVENPASGAQLPVRYFVVSALGQPPVGNRLNPKGIAPFRCADPLRWVTSGFGVL
ncbi:hypothetical protein [Mycolicibacterium fallax]|uniref:ESX-1 scaffolding and assembly protein SaeC n=1 Tax=Mycolicibacterium fallax TaxID=1793 RepID=A0A1X1RA26_MYCFA|nr:hypothetical protein [Mycolicibacterium fallax]ORV02090.1 hypothetical protein AWC04_12430 [Mycolicibacterium fallax]HOW94725.1 hypothetical protein [Mycolicibacterium fallax]HSA40922.1 hypothetical protein [Mycobacterium sp.]